MSSGPLSRLGASRVDEGVVIVGAGQAGFWAARTLRMEGYQGSLTLLGDEDFLPYERPPLSKSILDGAEPTTAQLVSCGALQELGIKFAQNVRASAINRQARTVDTDVGAIPYSKLVVCTGGRARKFEGDQFDSDAIFYLRTMKDALLLRTKLATARRVLVIGGGWIGLEFAAAARKSDCEVTLIEHADALCTRSVPPEISSYLLQLHIGKGVSVHLSANLEFVQRGPAGTFARFDQVTRQFDLVVAGIGMVPNAELAQAAAIEVDGGILVNEQGLTSDPMIFAAGDVARRASPALKRIERLETWQNAQNSAIVAARALMAKPTAVPAAPWFWSDQYSHNFQIVGDVLSGVSEFKRVCSDEGFCLLYGSEYALTGAVALNAPREMRALRRLIEKRTAVDIKSLADANQALPRE